MTRLTAVSLAAMMLLSVLAGGVAAVSFDQETGNTSTQSDVAGNTNTVTFDPGNASKSLYVETDGYEGSASDLTLKLQPAQSGINTTLYENTTASTVDSAAGHYAFNMTHAELSDLARDADGGTYTLKIINGSGTVLKTEVTFDSSAEDDPAHVYVVGQSATSDKAALTPLVADSLEVSEQKAWWGLGDTKLSADFSTYTTRSQNASKTVIHLKDSDTVSAYDSAASAANEGEKMWMSTMWVNNNPQMMYNGEPTGNVTGSYTVYDADSDTLTIHHADDMSDTNLQIRSAAGTGEGYSFGELSNNFGFGTAMSGFFAGLANFIGF